MLILPRIRSGQWGCMVPVDAAIRPSVIPCPFEDRLCDVLVTCMRSDDVRHWQDWIRRHGSELHLSAEIVQAIIHHEETAAAALFAIVARLQRLRDWHQYAHNEIARRGLHIPEHAPGLLLR